MARFLHVLRVVFSHRIFRRVFTFNELVISQVISCSVIGFDTDSVLLYIQNLTTMGVSSFKTNTAFSIGSKKYNKSI